MGLYSTPQLPSFDHLEHVIDGRGKLKRLYLVRFLSGPAQLIKAVMILNLGSAGEVDLSSRPPQNLNWSRKAFEAVFLPPQIACTP